MPPDHRRPLTILLILLTITTALPLIAAAAAIGVNWGASSASSTPLPPSKVVPWLLKANGITRVRLPDADPAALQGLAGSGIGVVVGIPNEMLRSLSSSKVAAASWVHNNVTRYVVGGGSGGGRVRIEYVSIGDDPFLSNGQKFQEYIVGAATNVQRALKSAKLPKTVKVIVPCSPDVYQSNSILPSKGRFRADLNKTMTELLSFLRNNSSPFVLDINIFSMHQRSKNLSLEFVAFQEKSHPVRDGASSYHNLFDISIDTLVSSLSKAGYREMDIIVGKIGWPTDGALNATIAIAQTFVQGLIDHLQSGAGTPLRPKRPPRATFLFSLLDEDQQSIDTGSYQRHWGMFTFDGQAKYNVDLGQGSKALVNAHNVNYLATKWCVVDNNKDTSNVSTYVASACSSADCTALSPGGSCYAIGWPSNVSYAFNSYFQQHDQNAESCDFNGLGLITTVDPSVGDCRFKVALDMSFSTRIGRGPDGWLNIVAAICSMLFFFWTWY